MADVKLDRYKTCMQETGRCRVLMLTLAELTEIITDLGLDPRYVKLLDGDLVVRDGGRDD